MPHSHSRGTLAGLSLPLLMAAGPVAGGLMAGNLAAQTTTAALQASKDNTLYESSTGALSNGKGTRCFVGITSGLPPALRRRAVLAFSLAGKIPPFAKITKVDLVLNVVQTKALTARAITLHALTADWGEGTSNAGCSTGPRCGGGSGTTSTTNDATWIHPFYKSKKWTTAGGDFNGTASGSAAVTGTGKYTWASTTRMVADVQGWLDKPNTNFGWLLQGSVSAWAIATREHGTAALRPQLVVTYTPPAARVTSTGTGCKGSGSTALTLGATGRPTVPSTTFALNLQGGPKGPSFFALGFALFGNGVPLGGGCRLYVNPTPILVVLSGPSTRVLPAPIPNQSALLGLEAIWQGAVTDSVTAFLITSNALTARLGR